MQVSIKSETSEDSFREGMIHLKIRKRVQKYKTHVLSLSLCFNRTLQLKNYSVGRESVQT